MEEARDYSILSKSLPNKIYLEEKFFRYKMQASKSLEESLDDFNRICMDLANIGEKLVDENQAIILLNSLPENYKEVKTAIKYSMDLLSLSTVLDDLRSKDFEIKSGKKKGSRGLGG